MWQIWTSPRLRPSQEPHPPHRERVGADHPATLDSCIPPAPPRASPSARWHRGALFSGPGARGRPPREAASTRLLRPFLSTTPFDSPLRSFFSYSEGRRGVVKEKERSGGRMRGTVPGAFLSVAAIPAGLPHRGCARQWRMTQRLKRWPAHIFHPPSRTPPVPKWCNDAISHERRSRRAPEKYAPATFSAPPTPQTTTSGAPQRGSSPSGPDGVVLLEPGDGARDHPAQTRWRARAATAGAVDRASRGNRRHAKGFTRGASCRGRTSAEIAG